jgi:hypothetical protein
MHPYLMEKEIARRAEEMQRSLLQPRSARSSHPIAHRSAAGMARALRSVANRLDPAS